MPHSFLAVDFFFVLSGFIIAHSYHSRLENGLGLAAFMRGRLMRLYPLYLVGITIPLCLFIITVFTQHDHQSRTLEGLIYLLHLLFLPTPPQLATYHTAIFPLDGVAWSLSLEIWINVIYALFYKWLSLMRLLGLITLSAIGLYWSGVHYMSLNVGYFWDHYMGGWIRVSYSFFAGILLYMCYTRYSFPRLPSWVALVLGISMIAIFSHPNSGITFPFISMLILCPAIVWLGAHVPLSGVSRNIAEWLGKISYAVYITHLVIFDVLKQSYESIHRDPVAHINATVGLWTVIAVLFAWLLDDAYDVPVRNWLKRRWVTAST
jgi:peptidoglycan/LPS O-acetylase OafA/YrhL